MMTRKSWNDRKRRLIVRFLYRLDRSLKIADTIL